MRYSGTISTSMLLVLIKRAAEQATLFIMLSLWLPQMTRSKGLLLVGVGQAVTQLAVNDPRSDIGIVCL